ncbi:MAG: enoyl-CoA hydratase/isomerase family protein [Syntrophaceae bacterium]
MGSEDYKTLLVSRRESFLKVTLNRPHELNALTHEMRKELEECFTRSENDDSVRAVLITGGDYVFSAGMDIKEISSLPDGEIDDYFKSITSYLLKIYLFKKPVVAAVGGIALGGGFNLATVCDIIIASESAIFGHPELKFGLNPLFDPLRRIVGMAKAKEITMLGEPIGAQEALRIGLVNKIAPPDRFMEEAEITAAELSRRSATALEAVKKISDVVPRLDKRAALEHEFEISALLYSRAERKEHMKKFISELEKRKK